MSHIIVEKMLCVLAYGENGSLGNSQHLMSFDVAENLQNIKNYFDIHQSIKYLKKVAK